MRDVRIGVAGLIAVAVVAATAGAAAQSAQVFEGKQKFELYCATCHGAEGKGDGTLAKQLRTRPADLTQLAKKYDGKFPADKVAQLIDGRTRDAAHLKADMPVWGEVFSKAQGGTDPNAVKDRIDALVKYLETIQEKPKA